MKRKLLTSLSGLLAFTSVAVAQTTTSRDSGPTLTSTGFAPFNFGNLILTSTPSNATGASGVSAVFTSSGSEFTFGAGGRLVDPAQFNYVVTGPNTATLSSPGTNGIPGSTTDLVFTSANGGTYTTVNGSDHTTGSFGLSAIPAAAPIENVSTRTTLTNGGNAVVGFVIGGTMPRRVLVRAVGPGLVAFGVTNPLRNPTLSLYRGSQLIATNDDWGTLMAANTGGTAPIGGDLAIGPSAEGSLSGGISGSSTSTAGTATSPGSTSSSTPPGTGSASPTSSATANGFGSGTFADGSSFSTQLASNADFVAAGAFALPSGSGDAAFIATLPPGAYTLMVSSSTALASGNAGAGSAVVGGITSSNAASVDGSLSATVTSGTSGTNFGSASGSLPTAAGSIGVTSATTATGPTAGTTLAGAGGGNSTAGTTGSGSMGAGSPSGMGSTAGTGTMSGTPAASATGDVLIEVYFIQ